MLRPVWRYDRPRGGVPVDVYRRGFVWRGRFVVTPEELRAAVGLPDAEFDAFVAARPDVKAWYELAARAEA